MTNEKNTKNDAIINNSQFKERFQFLLTVNGNIICQRYFKVNGLDENSLISYELKETLDEIVGDIKEDLNSKSRIYLWYTVPSSFKLTGFNNCETSKFCEVSESSNAQYDEGEIVKPFDVTFKFTFMDGNTIVYEKIWDGSAYPKYIRNSVDISNSDIKFKNCNASMLPFNLALLRHLVYGRKDLIYYSINKLCNVMCRSYCNKYGFYTFSNKYGDKTYYYSIYKQEKEYINGWREAVRNKTQEYFQNLYPSDRECERIDRFL